MTRTSILNDPRIRGYAYQALLVAALAALALAAGYNAYVNMAARGIPMGFSFWDQTAGFDINQKLKPIGMPRAAMLATALRQPRAASAASAANSAT